MNRTDIHSPSQFNPSDYTVIDYIDTKPPMPDVSFFCGLGQAGMEAAAAAFEQERKNWQESILRHFPNWLTGGDDHKSIHQCNHCGAHIRYVAVIEYIPTGARLAFGEICAERTHIPNQDEFKKKFARDARAAAQRRAEIEAHQAAYRTENPEVAAYLDSDTYEKFEFLVEMKIVFRRYGMLTENQTAAVKKVLAKRAEEAAKKEAEPEVVVPFPTGRVVVRGEVLTTRLQDSDFGSVWKMLVKDLDGNKYWGSIPSAIQSDCKGQQIEFTATCEVSNNDPHFGFFKRPAKARVVSGTTVAEEVVS